MSSIREYEKVVSMGCLVFRREIEQGELGFDQGHGVEAGRLAGVGERSGDAMVGWHNDSFVWV